MSDTKHTPTPYSLDAKGFVCAADGAVLIACPLQHVDVDGPVVMSSAQPRANAEFIVRACNEHDGLLAERSGLLAACELALAELRRLDDIVGDLEAWVEDEAIEACEAAIAEVKP